MNIRILLMVALLGLVPGAGSEALAQTSRPLSMEDAVREAVEANRNLAAAEARADAAVAGIRGQDSFLWPNLGLEAGTLRTNDPVGVFGAKLRQGRFTMEDFDVDALNHPDPVTDWSAAAGVSWRIADPAAWVGRESARSEADAVRWGARRTREATEFRARALYLDAVRARSQLGAAQASEQAASATRELFARRRDEGVLTDADVLQAEAELQAAEAARIHAEQLDLDSRVRLGVFLGWDEDQVPEPTDQLTPPQPVASPMTENLGGRADLRAMAAGVEAAEARARQAGWTWAPSLEAFGRAAMHSESLDGFENNWTVGVQLRWPVFTGFGIQAQKDRAQATARAMDLERQQALAEARAELDEASRGVRSAARRAEAVQAAAESAAEARRLMERRFQEGLATSVDLLQAEARLTQMRAQAVDALADYHLAVARLAFVTANQDDLSR